MTVVESILSTVDGDMQVNDFKGSSSSPWPWRARARVAATLGNSLMVIYIYLDHLVSLEWERFGSFQKLNDGDSFKARDYLWAFNIEPLFEHLRVFTFSEAMLYNLNLYVVVGTPVALTLLVLERQRVRWLQNMLSNADPSWASSWNSRFLQFYINVFSVTLSFIIAIAPFHLGWPEMHYACALCAMSCGCFSIVFYLLATDDLSATALDDPEVRSWAVTMALVRPVLKFVVALHAMVLLSALWKAESLGNDHAALLFGVIETSLVLGYQLFAGVFVWDDLQLSRQAADEKTKDLVHDGLSAALISS